MGICEWLQDGGKGKKQKKEAKSSPVSCDPSAVAARGGDRLRKTSGEIFASARDRTPTSEPRERTLLTLKTSRPGKRKVPWAHLPP